MFMHHPSISSDLVFDLDAQLNRLGAVAHVVVGSADTPELVAIGHAFPGMIPLNYPPISSFVEAELIATRLNTMQGIGDRQRIVILRSMTGSGGR